MKYSKSKSRKQRQRQRQKGGEVVAYGGYGCIFEPALKCENVPTLPGQISKLMSVKHAEDEFTKIEHFKNILQKIPNYQDYFLLKDITLCKPLPLTAEDLKNYDKKCKPLNKKGIKENKINNSLDKVLAINMPDGGSDVEKIINSSPLGPHTVSLNNALINLLVHGIVPMNKLHVYHGDIKDSNILAQVTDGHLFTRIIDWGLSFVHRGAVDAKIKDIPRKIYRRPFQFNVPFSSVLFNKEFTQQYSDFLALHSNPVYYQIREFVINYIFYWVDVRGMGHLETINTIVKELTVDELVEINETKIKDAIVEYSFTYYYIVEYLSKILQKYTHNGQLDIMAYFNTIFLKNFDIWGFVSVYIIFYENLYKDFNSLNEYQIQFLAKIKYIIIHFLYEMPIQPIPINEVVAELTSLNELIAKFHIQHPSKKLGYLNAAKSKKRDNSKPKINSKKGGTRRRK
jgi:serine/threonine protein kinase